MKSKGPYIIGVAGPSCSGKTVLAERLVEELSRLKPVIISMDSYYVDLSHLELAQREKQNFDIPESIDWNLFVRHLEMLADDREIKKPLYDFSAHTRFDYTRKIRAGRIVIIEGIFALYDERARKSLDLKIFVEIDDKTALERRLARDMRERARSKESVLQQYENTVRPMNEKYILPSSLYADIRVRGEESPENSAGVILEYIKTDRAQLFQ